MDISNPTPFFSRLLADVTPKHKAVRITTENTVLTFRVVADAPGLQVLKKKASDFVKMCERNMVPAQFAALMPIDNETAARCSLLSQLSADDLTVWQFVELAMANALFFETLCSAVDHATNIEATVEMGEAVEASKNESSETPLGETAS